VVETPRALFVPTAVIGGFLALALGPEGIGRFWDSNGIFPDQMFAIWGAIPALLVNVMSASLLLGERLPAPRKIWGISPRRSRSRSSPHWAFRSSRSWQRSRPSV
jgi:hypothetical protein